MERSSLSSQTRLGPFSTRTSPEAMELFLNNTMICHVDFRQFYSWDRIADQLRSLTLKDEDPTDLLVNIVLDGMDKRRRRWPRFSISFKGRP
jgi:hypothetical protein